MSTQALEDRIALIEASARVALSTTTHVQPQLMQVAAQKFVLFYYCEKPSAKRDEQQFVREVAAAVRRDIADADQDADVITKGVQFACHRLGQAFRSLGDSATGRVLARAAYRI